MANLKNLTWYVAVGFAASMITRAMAAPSPAVGSAITVPSSNEVLYSKGIHTDNATQTEFELYSLNHTSDGHDAFAHYLEHFHQGAGLERRDWYNCEFPNHNYIQKFCCNSAHGIGAFVSATGATVAGIYLESLLKEAIDGKRDNQKPRSICLTRDKKNLCVSWASYSTDVATSGEEDDITKYSLQCAASGGSSEYKTTTTDGGILFICVSDRADGCGANVG